MASDSSDSGSGSTSLENWGRKSNLSGPIVEAFLRINNIWPFYERTFINIVRPLFPVNRQATYSNLTDAVTSAIPNADINGTTEIRHAVNSTNDFELDTLSQSVINSSIVIICLLGFVGNGLVIWLLGFRIKRNPFTVYILNLSVADFGVLIFLTCTAVTVDNQYNRDDVHLPLFLIFLELFFFTYSTSQFLLAAISIDRCVAVLFPLWHRYHRPPALSTIACALIWILSFVLSVTDFTLHKTLSSHKSPLLHQLVVNVLVCTPIMVISTLTLFIEAWCKSKQRQQGKLVTTILLALLSFLIFTFPLNLFYIINYYHVCLPSLMLIGFACASLNSSINPLIYFLVGRRQKKGQPRVSLKGALQRVFKDEQDCTEEQKNTNQSFV